MGKRICKKCGIEKDYSYLCLNTQGRLTYKDNESGGLWHGKTCWQCFKGYVKTTSGKEPLGDRQCACGAQFKQKNIRQVYCSRKCWDLAA